MHPSSLWTTQWQKENRPAVFAPPADYFDRSSLHCIWGSSFAYDCLNLARNERPSLDEDITIFFAGVFFLFFPGCILRHPVASGDLRNTIRTVNSLPEGYSGKCRILINDCDSVVACRNALILDILQSAQMLDVAEVAEFCVHLTYSAFLTPTQHQILASCLSSFMERRTRFDVNDAFMRNPKHLFAQIFIEPLLQMYTSTFDGPTAKRNMHEATLGAARLDNLQSWLWPLRSAHRLAEMHYRRTGVVLPFGVSTSHFTHPNKCVPLSPAIQPNLTDSHQTSIRRRRQMASVTGHISTRRMGYEHGNTVWEEPRIRWRRHLRLLLHIRQSPAR